MQVAATASLSGGLQLQSVHTARDGTRKLVFALQGAEGGGATGSVETVLIPMTNRQGKNLRYTACLSTQVCISGGRAGWGWGVRSGWLGRARGWFTSLRPGCVIMCVGSNPCDTPGARSAPRTAGCATRVAVWLLATRITMFTELPCVCVYPAPPQVGCAMNCQFCYTGRMGLLGNLSTQQIVEQVVEVRAWVCGLRCVD